jgi:hypothetical protein
MVWNKHLNNDDVDFEKDIRIDTTVNPIPVNKPYQDILGPAYKAKALYKRSEVEVILTPFVNLSQWFRPGETKPHPNSDAFTYGIWMYNTEVK